MQRGGSFIVACGLSGTPWRIKFPDRGLSPGPLPWKPAVLATGPPGKSRGFPSFHRKPGDHPPALHLLRYYRHSVSGTPIPELPPPAHPQTAPGWTSQDPCPLMGPGSFTAGVAVMRALAAGVLAAGCGPGHTLGWRVSASPVWAGLASIRTDWSPKRAIHHPQS